MEKNKKTGGLKIFFYLTPLYIILAYPLYNWHKNINSGDINLQKDEHSVFSSNKGEFKKTPYSSWQRRMNENHTGLLRRYLPQGTDLSKVSEEELQDIVSEINNRPKKIFGFKTSAEVYNSYISCSD